MTTHRSTKKIIFTISKYIAMFLVTLLVADITGCSHPNGQPQNMPQFASKTDVRRYAYLGLHQLRAGRYRQARVYFAKGLRENPVNCELNFFNGLAYQLEGEDGNIQMLELAKVGYQNAIRACPNDPWPYYYNGVVALEQNNFLLAEHMFSAANAVSGDSITTFLKAYLYTAYNIGDIKGVKAAIIQLRKADPNSKLVADLSATFKDIRTPKHVSKKMIAAKKKKHKKIAQTHAAIAKKPTKPIVAKTKAPAVKAQVPPPLAAKSPAPAPAVAATTPAATTAKPVLAQSTPAPAPQATAPAPAQTALPQPASIPQQPTSMPMQQNGNSGFPQPVQTPNGGFPQQSPPDMQNSDFPQQGQGGMQSGGFPQQGGFGGGSGGFPQQGPGMPGAPGFPGQKVDHRQVLVDGVIILSRETLTSQQGLNLLHGLQLQYGSSSAPGLSYTNSSFNSNGYSGLAVPAGSTYTLPTLPFSSSTVNTISVPAVTYDLNIFNDADEKSQILARPTVLVESGHTATYFSGKDLILGIQGTQTGTISQFPLGVTMALTPYFQKNGSIDLNVEIGREFLIPTTTTNSSTTFSQVAQALKEKTTTGVNLHYGQTIILSTLYDSKLDTTRDETPVLSKIPIIGLFFGKKTKANTITNLIMLLTPRKYIQFKSDKYTEMTMEQLTSFYTERLKKRTHLSNIIKKLRNLEIYDLQSPVQKALSKKEVGAVTADETEIMDGDKQFGEF